ncbi:hypothetical protein PAP_03555 [Palaeococcus pacificus DY20341]|uniref:Uncharacterized protein n=1 Tax=Palaeococcus pacificus DY20341 TaxID=1343739 RepID=A0A075LSR1_9EURY|nr:hypothetical protein [Palaeococcus pacificus]AIF69131.1 hypothetical protein PAP_03555 [Palaeococcus pacificus DY20341]
MLWKIFFFMILPSLIFVFGTLIVLAMDSKDWWKVLAVLLLIWLFINAEHIKEYKVVRENPALSKIMNEVVRIKAKILHYIPSERGELQIDVKSLNVNEITSKVENMTRDIG